MIPLRRHILQLCFVLLFSSSAAWAQASRVWVSGVGDDTFPCSRTAPCKTFSAALSRVADGGEIDVLDSAGYGAVTINKAVTIDGYGALAGILHSGTVGVTINAPTTATVTLRNLSIDGAMTGTTGVRIQSAGRVVLENLAIRNDVAGSGIGIDIAVATPVNVDVRNCSISNTLGAGIHSGPTGTSVKLSVDHSSIKHNATGIFLFSSTSAAVTASTISQNGLGLYIGDSTSSAHIHASTLSENDMGVNVNGPVAFWGSQIVGNDLAFTTGPGGEVSTHGNNAIIGNGNLGTPPVSVGLQ